ncbi:MAG: insulinase family protein [Candidatus Baltobacteraceae bacterium]
MIKTAAAICISISLLCYGLAQAYTLRADTSVPNAAIELWFRAPGAGFENGTPGIARLAATTIAASRSQGALSLADIIKGVGGRLSIDVYPDIASISALVPADDAPQVLGAMTRAYFSPLVSADGLKAAQRDLAVAIAQQQFNSDGMLHDLLLAQLFASGPQHYPVLPVSIAPLVKLGVPEVTAFASRAFRAQNAVVSLAGNLSHAVMRAAFAGRIGDPIDPPLDSTLAAAAASTTAVGYDPGVGLAWPGPAIRDTRATTALDFIADYLFRGESGVVARQVDDLTPDVYLNGQFITLHNPGAMLVTISGKGYDSVRQSVLGELLRLQQPLDAAVFSAARNAFEYHILSDTQTILSQADNAGWYTVEGNPDYAPGGPGGGYLQAAESLDPQFVAEVARKYLSTPTVVELVPRSK